MEKENKREACRKCKYSYYECFMLIAAGQKTLCDRSESIKK